MGPPSSGGSTVGEIAQHPRGLRPVGASRARRRCTTTSRPRAWPTPTAANTSATRSSSTCRSRGLLSDQFAAERRGADRPDARRPAPPAVDPDDDPSAGARHRRVDRRRRQGSTTTHLTVADRWGNVVDYTFTIEQTGGNGMVVPGYGFLLNNELTDFDLDATASARAPNSLPGGKRPRSSIAPTIVLRNGKPFLALGSPGGATIITTVAADPAQPPRLRHDAARGDRRAAREPAQQRDDAGRGCVHVHARGGGAHGPGPELTVTTTALRPRDRRGDRHRVPRQRRGAGRGRAVAARRRQRDGGRLASVGRRTPMSRGRRWCLNRHEHYARRFCKPDR